MKLIYVCTPYDIDNEKESREYATKAAKYVLSKGDAPVIPYIQARGYMNRKKDSWKQENENLLDKCDEMYVFSENVTEQMSKEIDYFKGRILHVQEF